MDGKATVLCIDDNASGVRSRKMLLEAKGFEVLTAEEGTAGLAIADREHLDLVVLDYKLPGMDGGAVAQELRTRHPEVPILLLTGFPGEIPETVLSLVDSFRVKGEPPSKLIEEVERLTGARAKPALPSTQVLDDSRRRLQDSQAALEKSKRVLKRSHRNRR